MPPKLKFTKDEIIAAALNLVRREGIEGLTSRGLGGEMGTTSRPVFTAFQNMEEVQNEMLKAAKSAYNGYLQEGLAQDPPFRGIGMQYFRFAKEEPKLFEILFMRSSEPAAGVAAPLFITHDNYEKILTAIQDSYGISKVHSNRMLQTMWLFVHGIACLQITGMIRFTDDEVEERLIEVFSGVLLMLKNTSEKLKSGKNG